mmetsp:Transcript_25008/g.33155  ORF Transcript_25008/g.33155 Transcript_25008/m.33155 type:complete len:96 (+) Transcript_25008:314-601(+)
MHFLLDSAHFMMLHIPTLLFNLHQQNKSFVFYKSTFSPILEIFYQDPLTLVAGKTTNAMDVAPDASQVAAPILVDFKIINLMGMDNVPFPMESLT